MATARPRAAGRPSANAGSAHSASSASDVYYRDHHILTEYRQLREHAPPGVYVVPSERSLLVWEGLICVRQSFYAGGMFRFELRLADKYVRPSDGGGVSFSVCLGGSGSSAGRGCRTRGALLGQGSWVVDDR